MSKIPKKKFWNYVAKPTSEGLSTFQTSCYSRQQHNCTLRLKKNSCFRKQKTDDTKISKCVLLNIEVL